MPKQHEALHDERKKCFHAVDNLVRLSADEPIAESVISAHKEVELLHGSLFQLVDLVVEFSQAGQLNDGIGGCVRRLDRDAHDLCQDGGELRDLHHAVVGAAKDWLRLDLGGRLRPRLRPWVRRGESPLRFPGSRFD